MQSEEVGVFPVLVFPGERAPVDLLVELVDVVRRRCAVGAGDEVLVGCEQSSGRLALFVAAGTVPGSLVPAAANGNGHAPPKPKAAKPRQAAPSKRRPSTPVGAGVVPEEWLRVLVTLHGDGGEISDATGKAVRRLAPRLGLGTDAKTLTKLAGVVRKLESHRYVSRDSRGKKTATFTIRLEPAGLALVDNAGTEPATEARGSTGGGSGRAAVQPVMDTPAPGADVGLQDRLRARAASAL